ncbi:MAG: hypothetical protein AB1631_03820 [Acidobacteriota bacterium]
MKTSILFVVLALVLSAAAAPLQTAPQLSALARMPVREITVFKDGHVFVLHEGAMPTDASGNVLMDYLPAPVLGTFWPYSADKGVKLSSVLASQRRVRIEHTALNLRDLIEANAGAEVIISENAPAGSYSGTLLGIPSRSSEEIEATALPNSGEKLPERGDVALVKTNEGVKVVPLSNIRDVIFKTDLKPRIAQEEFRNLLTLKLDWGARAAERTANVGLVYLQKGIRWIPSYRITLDGRGGATVRLQAMLLNELTDIQNVTANLVIGVPTFAFKDTLDPISLQRTSAQLSQYFQQGDRAQMLSNAIMSQSARMTERVAPQEQPVDLGPGLPESSRNEDLFIFTVRNISLRKGERMAMTIAEFTLPYKDVFALDLPYSPPPEVRRNVNNEREMELARLFAAPKVAHKIRLTNQSSYPLTTAPALIIKDDRVLAQGMMTYTAIGAKVDLEITKAVDIQVAKNETETRRTPNALRWQGNDYARVELTGALTLTNYRNIPVDIEVTRHALGHIDTADNNGQITKINILEDGSYQAAGDYPSWWGWYNWPWWWHHLNGVGRIRWDVKVQPGGKIDLSYTWHYFWQ